MKEQIHTFEPSTKEEKEYIRQKLVEYNSQNVPISKEKPVKDLSYTVKDSDGNIIGGITGYTYWGCLQIDIFWIDEKHRKSGLGTKLLNQIETEAKRQGCHLAHLDTFDFQAEGFYIKNGYEVFGVIDHCPEGHKRYYLKKNLR